MKQRLLPLLIILGGFVIDGVAQTRCRIFGTVRDNEGNPIELAAVRVEGRPLLITAADLHGRYALSVPTTDSLTVVFSMIGYETRKRTLLPASDSLRIDVVLPAAGALLGEAVARGQGVQTTPMQKVEVDHLRRAPSVGGNAVEETIATQAGVSTHNELSSQYNVRGGSFDENVVYLNGIELHRPFLVRSGQQEGLSAINSDMVESVRFSSGGFEARYGDKMSSVLDITYKRPERFEATAAASMLGASAYVGTGNRRISLMTSLRYKTAQYLLSSLDTDGDYRPAFLDYQVYASWRPSSHWTLDLLGNIADNRYDFRPRDRETRFGTMFDAKSFRVYFDGEERDRFSTRFGAATLTRHFTPQTFLALQASTFASRERETYDIQGQYWLNEATTSDQLGVGTYMEHARNHLRARVINLGLRFRTRIQAHTLQAGIDWRHENIRENAREWEMRDSMGYSLPHLPDRLRLIYALRSRNAVSTRRLELFLQDTWRRHTAAGLLNLTAGLRLSHSDLNGETLLSPRLSLGFLPAGSERWTFRFATGLYYPPPFYKELRDTTLSDGIATVRLNRDIKSQRSVHFVLGGDYTFRLIGRPFKFTTEVYYKALSRLIPYTVDNVRIVYAGRNLSSGYAAGVDFKLFGEFVPGTDSWLTLSLMKTEEKIGGVWLPRPTDQRFNLSLHFTDYFPGSTRWTLTLRAALAAGLPFGPPHSDRTVHTFRAPAYKRVDVGLNYCLFRAERRNGRRPLFGTGRFLNNAWLGLDCFNLPGIRNVNAYYWVTDITNTRYAVPNYLTGRLLNLRLALEF